jgi:hypothetical protein
VQDLNFSPPNILKLCPPVRNQDASEPTSKTVDGTVNGGIDIGFYILNHHVSPPSQQHLYLATHPRPAIWILSFRQADKYMPDLIFLR